MLRPGGVRPAGLVGDGDAGELLADCVPEAAGLDVADRVGVGPADGVGEAVRPGSATGGDRAVALEPGVFAWAVRPLCAAAAGARGAAHSVNGASGPPAMATTIAPRQIASPAADTAPIRRMVRRRRPDGSANTGLECTAGV